MRRWGLTFLFISSLARAEAQPDPCESDLLDVPKILSPGETLRTELDTWVGRTLRSHHPLTRATFKGLLGVDLANHLDQQSGAIAIFFDASDESPDARGWRSANREMLAYEIASRLYEIRIRMRRKPATASADAFLAKCAKNLWTGFNEVTLEISPQSPGPCTQSPPEKKTRGFPLWSQQKPPPAPRYASNFEIPYDDSYYLSAPHVRPPFNFHGLTGERMVMDEGLKHQIILLNDVMRDIGLADMSDWNPIADTSFVARRQWRPLLTNVQNAARLLTMVADGCAIRGWLEPESDETQYIWKSLMMLKWYRGRLAQVRRKFWKIHIPLWYGDGQILLDLNHARYMLPTPYQN